MELGAGKIRQYNPFFCISQCVFVTSSCWMDLDGNSAYSLDELISYTVLFIAEKSTVLVRQQ